MLTSVVGSEYNAFASLFLKFNIIKAEQKFYKN